MRGFFKKQILLYSIFFIFATIVNGSTIAPLQKQTQLDITVNDLANRLFNTNNIQNIDSENNIAITSFVNLDQLNNTTHLGRALSESFFDELFTRGFSVSDFRGQKTISTNANGEYYLTRDTKLLKDTIENSYILVGTYTVIENSVLINARIMDNQNGKIVASAKSYYNTTDCKILNNCKRKRRISIVSHDNYIIKRIANRSVNNINTNTSMPLTYNSTRIIKRKDILNRDKSIEQSNQVTLIN